MFSKSKFVTLLILTFSASLVLAQTKQVIVHKMGHDGDSLKKEILVDHKINIEFLGDSLQDHFLWSHEGNFEVLGDSALKKVFVHKMPRHERKAARIVIKKSGFFRKNKIVIDFDPMTQAIIKVVDNDKDVSPNKFHKYQNYLEDATEFAELEALHPRMEELEFKMQSFELADSEKLAGLEAILIDLEALESDRALFKREHYSSLIKVIELENLEEVFQDILEDAGVTPPQKIESISIKEGKFFVNGDEIKGDVGEKCLQAYMGHSNLSPEDIHKKGEEISIEIKFD
ncbi:MAG: hypothetical protein HOD43_04515 [Candidatus Marinimicrobia bacterium]|jgi:hypothetical protein|nr:hypothetical protein [Candidatus Neomarinimicrobiota bacterium]MBT3632194.1 hypothetical protein [Candidatus Neomarinimicrobiota bacterium]MBT3824349.1 hypothetical protein [Candidatus Neomarinimicrobiota bacterium]MBT4130062.1 hypothetical protein [Candidatus Neomarinimicrobiota bacterium]MBT4295049.1 hypothetical protein [Candidatus Neomarinimicrobiota bacterium]